MPNIMPNDCHMSCIMALKIYPTGLGTVPIGFRSELFQVRLGNANIYAIWQQSGTNEGKPCGMPSVGKGEGMPKCVPCGKPGFTGVVL